MDDVDVVGEPERLHGVEGEEDDGPPVRDLASRRLQRTAVNLHQHHFLQFCAIFVNKL